MTVPPIRSRSLPTYLALVKFEHTLFALPFAYGGMLLAAGGWPGWRVFALVTLAMVGARTAAMALNRVIDASVDAANPRTSGREIPMGKLTRADGVVLALLGFAVLVVAGALLNRLTLLLLPVAVAFLTLYPYTKRVTWLCHFWLGVTIGAAAAGGWIAVTGAFAPTAVALWLAVGAWIAGFDIIYALLDLRFDRHVGLHSVPVRFGTDRALGLSAATHVLSFAALAAVAWWTPLGWPYLVALLGTAAVLVYEQVAVRRSDVASVLRSFNANLVVGVLVLAGIVGGLALAG